MSFKPFENKIFLSSPTMHGEEMEFIQDAFKKNWIAPLGENVDNFEKEAAACTGVSHAAALVSGTAGLHLAFRLAGVTPGSTVICQDMTFSATVNPAMYEGAKPVFIDSEEDSWNMDPKLVEKALDKYPDAKAVVPANLYGTPAHLSEIRDICRERKVTLVEDAAESLGASYKGEHCGSFGALGVLSFNGNKIITTSGGGMLLSEDEEKIKKARFMSTQAREPYPWYEHKELGFNYRMSNIVAGIGRGQLIHLKEHVAEKKRIYRHYGEQFKALGLPLSMNPYPADSKPNFWLSSILVDSDVCDKADASKDISAEYPGMLSGICPSAIIMKIMKTLSSYNVETRPIWKPMHLQPYYCSYDFIANEDHCVDEDIFRRGLCLPSDIKMTEAEQDTVIDMIASCF
ncbi:MAG: aminotransferase class I/II-fold pyridoxal phosphate-dependent enzyme [Lachnospiraceae bacterium]|nr:aminotransferase class I/II-fold pyridoxal phosphate-dependent enzyme [Lachnospiraceae bacterium]